MDNTPLNEEATIEELEAALPEEAVEIVNAQAAAVISRNKMINKRFYGRKERKAWLRMNRKSKVEAIEHGHSKIMALINHGIQRTKG